MVDLLVELLEHAGSILAARHTKVQALFFFGEHRFRIIMAVVATLPAVLLRHRRHHPPPQRPTFSKFHAVGECHCGVMPRRTVIDLYRWRDARVDKPRQKFRDIRTRERRHASLQIKQAGEQPVEPGALFRRERRGLGDEGWDRWPLCDAHAASRSAIALSTSISCRRANAIKLSSHAARFLR